MQDAIAHKHEDVARLLRKHGSELGYDEIAAAGELCELAKQGKLETVGLLLECGCNVNAADYDARTCLHLAASVGNLPICQLLLDRGADVNRQDRWGGTPLRDAVREGRKEVAVRGGAVLAAGGRDPLQLRPPK